MNKVQQWIFEMVKSEKDFELLKNSGMYWEYFPDGPEQYEEFLKYTNEFNICG